MAQMGGTEGLWATVQTPLVQKLAKKTGMQLPDLSAKILQEKQEKERQAFTYNLTKKIIEEGGAEENPNPAAYNNLPTGLGGILPGMGGMGQGEVGRPPSPAQQPTGAQVQGQSPGVGMMEIGMGQGLPARGLGSPTLANRAISHLVFGKDIYGTEAEIVNAQSRGLSAQASARQAGVAEAESPSTIGHNEALTKQALATAAETSTETELNQLKLDSLKGEFQSRLVWQGRNPLAKADMAAGYLFGPGVTYDQVTDPEAKQIIWMAANKDSWHPDATRPPDQSALESGQALLDTWQRTSAATKVKRDMQAVTVGAQLQSKQMGIDADRADNQIRFQENVFLKKMEIAAANYRQINTLKFGANNAMVTHLDEIQGRIIQAKKALEPKRNQWGKIALPTRQEILDRFTLRSQVLDPALNELSILTTGKPYRAPEIPLEPKAADARKRAMAAKAAGKTLDFIASQLRAGYTDRDPSKSRPAFDDLGTTMILYNWNSWPEPGAAKVTPKRK